MKFETPNARTASDADSPDPSSARVMAEAWRDKRNAAKNSAPTKAAPKTGPAKKN